MRHLSVGIINQKYAHWNGKCNVFSLEVLERMVNSSSHAVQDF